MQRHRHSTGCFVLRLVLIAAALAVGGPADALDQVSLDDLQASMRTLSFVESLPAARAIVVGVVYAPEVPESQAAAVDIAKKIGTMRGPSSRTLQSLVLSASDLDRLGGQLDVIFLAPGVARHPERILGAMSRFHLVSISNDPLCMISGCCVIMVRTDQQVDITVNTALADAVGARFSLVFMMMVKRR